MTSVHFHHGDCLDIMRNLPDNSVDAVVTDPPYGLANTDPAHVIETITRWAKGERDYLPGGTGFMGNVWDAFVPPVAVWDDCYRVLKPGGHVLAFAGSRTMDLMTLALRMAGFDIRDSIAWLYGSGFPKSLDVSKAIDKAAGATRARRPLVGGALNSGTANGWNGSDPHSATAPLAGTKWDDTPATPDAERWQGWGTALKPAFEPIVVARKPLSGTVAATVLEHGTGALNIDACRTETRDRTDYGLANATRSRGATYGAPTASADFDASKGRWPANVILDESQAQALDEQSGVSQSRIGQPRGANPGEGWGMTATGAEYDDTGGASRFFYVARKDDAVDQTAAATSPPNDDCCPDCEWEREHDYVLTLPVDQLGARFRYIAKAPKKERPNVDGVTHPTVKPLTLMRWLVRLVTPPGGTVLEPFAGSGATVEACILEGFNCVAIEREAEYLPLIESRIARAQTPAPKTPDLLDLLDGGAA